MQYFGRLFILLSPKTDRSQCSPTYTHQRIERYYTVYYRESDRKPGDCQGSNTVTDENAVC